MGRFMAAKYIFQRSRWQHCKSPTRGAGRRWRGGFAFAPRQIPDFLGHMSKGFAARDPRGGSAKGAPTPWGRMFKNALNEAPTCQPKDDDAAPLEASFSYHEIASMLSHQNWPA